MACGFVGVTLLARAMVASTADFKGTGQLGLGVVRTEMFRAGDPRGASHLHPQPLASGNVYSHNRMSQTTFWSPRKLGITNVKYVSAGVYHTIFVKTDNTVWAAGYNALGYQSTDFGNFVTPRMDALAEDGVTLSRYYSAPFCSPARVTTVKTSS